MAAVTVRIELVLVNLAAQGVAVYSQNFGGAGLVSVRPIQHAFDEALFEFPDGFVEQDSALHHLIDETFQLVFHDGTLRYELPV
jgi:hypothetical protein